MTNTLILVLAIIMFILAIIVTIYNSDGKVIDRYDAGYIDGVLDITDYLDDLLEEDIETIGVITLKNKLLEELYEKSSDND